MNDRLKAVLERIKTTWNKFNKMQKTLIISITSVVLVTLVILAMVLTKTNYVELVNAENTEQAAAVNEILVTNGITSYAENNGLRIFVPEESLVNATYLIAQEGVTASGYSIDDALSGGFSSTNADKEKLYQKYLEDKMEITLESFDYIKNASVTFTLPTNSLSIINKDEETTVAVFLQLSGTMPDDAPLALAQYIKTAVGNKTTNSITIITDSKVVFSGNALETAESTSATAQTMIREAYANEAINNVVKLLSTTMLYTSITVAPSLDIDFDKVDTVNTEYSNPNGKILQSSYEEDQESVNGSGGVPGTDSNDDDTSYYITDSDGSTSTISIRDYDYAVSSTITHTEGTFGKLDKTASSVAITVNKYVVYNEDTLREAGELDDLTWDEFKIQNSDSTEIEVPENLTEIVSKATGFPAENIIISAYQVPMFEATSVEETSITDYLQLIVAGLILLMLAFVVWKSLKPVEVTELEPELSVEELLSSTKESQSVEDIDLNEKSEIRKAIEKFVDENPEAVALLLRNWLNDDWD